MSVIGQLRDLETNNIRIDITVCNDGSTDGTGDAIRLAFPVVIPPLLECSVGILLLFLMSDYFEILSYRFSFSRFANLFLKHVENVEKCL